MKQKKPARETAVLIHLNKACFLSAVAGPGWISDL